MVRTMKDTETALFKIKKQNQDCRCVWWYSALRFTLLPVSHLSLVSMTECISCQPLSPQRSTSFFCAGEGRDVYGVSERVGAQVRLKAGGHPQLPVFKHYPSPSEIRSLIGLKFTKQARLAGQ